MSVIKGKIIMTGEMVDRDTLAKLTKKGKNKLASNERKQTKEAAKRTERLEQERNQRVIDYVGKELTPTLVSIDKDITKKASEGEEKYTKVWWVQERINEGQDFHSNNPRLKLVPQDVVVEKTLCTQALIGAVKTDLQARGLSVNDARILPETARVYGLGSDPMDIDYVTKRGYGIEIAWCE